MLNRSREETVLGLIALMLAGISPNLFPLAQAGHAGMSVTVPYLLLPAVILLGIVALAAWRRGHGRLVRRIVAGAGAGIIATLALEAVRITSFKLGGMPGDLPRLLGVLITDRFMSGPSLGSDILGHAYHYWNGAAFGVMFTVLLGRRPLIWSTGYALLIGLGFLASPAVKAMGVGFMASRMPAMQVTVVIAHIAFGLALGILTLRWLPPRIPERGGA